MDTALILIILAVIVVSMVFAVKKIMKSYNDSSSSSKGSFASANQTPGNTIKTKDANIPHNVGILLILISLVGSILAGSYYVFPGENFNYVIAISGFVGGVVLAGIFFAIGAVISRQNTIIELLKKPDNGK